MKRVATLAILAGMLVGGLVLFLRLGALSKVQAQAVCTSASFRGAYGYTFTGATGPYAAPFAAVGRLVADGQGNLSGAETASSDGEIFQRNYVGTYRVNADCTGSAITNDNFGKAVRDEFVIVSGGGEIHVIDADPDTVIVGTLKRQ